MMGRLCLFACLGLTWLAVITSCCALEYRVTTLAPLSGYANSTANDINDSGVVVGQCSTWQSSTLLLARACKWDAGGIHELAPLPGYAFSTAYAINNSGMVVGVSSNTDDMIAGRACYWDASGVHDLGTTLDPGVKSGALANT